MASFQAKIVLNQQTEKIKIIVSFRSNLTCNRKFKKNYKKIHEIKKNTIIASFQAKIGCKRLRNRENKHCRSVPFLPDPE